MRVYYSCHYDGRECDKAIPKFNEKGVLIPESNKRIKKEYKGIISETTLDNSWDACDDCPRNYSLSGCCYGKLKIGD